MCRGLKKKMKITQYPWQKSSEVEMDKLFVKLILEKQTKEPDGRKSVELEYYVDLFNPSMQDEGERILLKAGPGMGKTTLVKKITHDWVMGRFTNVSIVFFVLLKLVKPGEAIENVILNQTPMLEGYSVTADKVRRILEKFGSRCLLVLDGLDEHALGQNKDVVRIIEESKYPHCKVIVTSRPHSTRDIEEHFDVIGRVEGFTRGEATKFIKSIVDDYNKAEQILEFSPSHSKSPMYKIPILLSFMCFLVQNDNEVVTSLNKSEQKGWIYFRMVRCLYITYVKKIGKDFVSSNFVRAVRAVGKLAWQTLLSGDLMFRKGELGLEVFAYGLLIGDEDPEGLSDETADILVTFAHRSIQEFFGAFYFILSLSEGESVESLLGGDCEKPIFLTNPLFLEFCLWLMNSTELTSFPWEVETVREPLVTYLVGKIDKQNLDLDHEFYALNMTDGLDPMVLDLMKDVLSRCSNTECLTLDISLPVDELLSTVDPCLWDSQIHTLCLVKNFSCHYRKPPQPERELLIRLDNLQNPLEMLHVALKYCYRAERSPGIGLGMARDSSLELSELLHIKGMCQLHVDCGEEGAGVSCHQDIPHCPSLRQLSVTHFENGDDVLSALRKAIQRGRLPNLNYLDFYGSSFETDEILPYLYGSLTPALEHLDLEGARLNKSDLQFISELRTLRVLCLSIGSFLRETETVKFLFQNQDGEPIHRKWRQVISWLNFPKCCKKLTNPSRPWSLSANVWATLSILSVNYIDSESEFLDEFVRVVNENKLPNLKELFLSHWYDDKTDLDIDVDIFLLKLQADKLPSLKHLSLTGFIFSGEEVQDLAQRLVKWDLEELSLVGSKGISGHLSVLFRHCLPSLETLVLSQCDLNSDDMRCLKHAREQSKLPKLEHLNVTGNRIKDPEMWTKIEAWKNVKVYHNSQEYYDSDSDFRDSYSDSFGFENSDSDTDSDVFPTLEESREAK